MKKLFFLIFITQLSFAQKTIESETSNAEKFSAKAGSLIKKEYIDIGKVKSVEIKVLHYSDLITNQNTSAVKLEYEYTSSYSTDTKIAVLDADEIDAVIKSIKIIQEKISVETPVNYTEIAFSTRDGFQCGCFFSKGKWSAYMKLEKYDGNSYVFLDKELLGSLLATIESAKQKL